MEQPVQFYDSVYEQIVQRAESIEDIRKRTLPVARHAVGSVLDIGCGLGVLSDMVDGDYHGVDFSEFAIEWARHNTTNEQATFEVGYFFDISGHLQFDTVVLTEVLEHIENLERLAEIAKLCAKHRIIVTVPVDMEYVAHVKPKWSFDDIAQLFGEPTVKAVIGGKWLLAVCDVNAPLVSVCMIVRNEQDCLYRALNSTVGLTNDIVVVDTGSTDDTLHIARDYGCRVYTGADRMNKAAARNTAINKALGEWVVILDADETIEDPLGLRTYLAMSEAPVLYIRLAYTDDMVHESMSFSQIRCFRRGMMRYQYRAHEIPVPINGSPALAQMTDFRWWHKSPPGRDEWKLKYSLDRILLDVQENPGDPRPVYYLGRQYMYLKRYDEALRATKQYIKMGGGVDTADAWFNIARCYYEMGDPTHRSRVTALHQACAAAPERREFWGTLADVYWKLERKELAVNLMKTALAIPQPETGQVQHGWFGDRPYKILERWERELHNQ